MPEDLNFSDFATLPITEWKELLSVMSQLDSLQLNSEHVELPLALGEVNFGALQKRKKRKNYFFSLSLVQHMEICWL